MQCGEFKRTYEKLSDKMVCIAELRRDHPIEKSEWIEEDGFEPSDFNEMIAKLNEIDGPIC